jgi:hypothetical protein
MSVSLRVLAECFRDDALVDIATETGRIYRCVRVTRIVVERDRDLVHFSEVPVTEDARAIPHEQVVDASHVAAVLRGKVGR